MSDPSGIGFASLPTTARPASGLVYARVSAPFSFRRYRGELLTLSGHGCSAVFSSAIPFVADAVYRISLRDVTTDIAAAAVAMGLFQARIVFIRPMEGSDTVKIGFWWEIEETDDTNRLVLMDLLAAAP